MDSVKADNVIIRADVTQSLALAPTAFQIFESKGELGVFCNTKKQVTIPQEFHFAIDERIPPPTNVADLFDKLLLNSETHHDKKLPRNTAPNPFHLHTEKQLEEERARVPKANPYPYTTDYPVLPPKPEPKPSTKPEPFQLESLVRHKEELQQTPFQFLRKFISRSQKEHQVVERAEFDKKIKEKEVIYKRYKKETESEKMVHDVYYCSTIHYKKN
ncbi:hypothetical protein POM88_038581 [Heracleum sosnowskyi]|uniref:TPX2 central domain-containing protein n=1 Tax=Heracleum sosnowskyi TaxID=360622 RepID=A0AAD8H8R7_9APIA|nr:hypothetical protein POM88_038581 [Heracleum sosnowskyi]